MRKKLFLFIFVFTPLLFLSTPVFANPSMPNFPSCTNPQGSIIAQYDSGVHAIAGQDVVTGSDTVYSVDGTNAVTQCFCPPMPQTNGIQTNWLQASTLSEEEKQNLVTNGWITIDNGSDWGLANAPYLAKNSNYSCPSISSPLRQGSEGQAGLSVTPAPTVCITPSEITPTISETPTPSATPTATPTPSTSSGPTATPEITTPPTPTQISAQVENANETNTSSGSTSTNNSGSNSPTSSGYSTSGSPSVAGGGIPTTLPSTGGSEELYLTLGASIAALSISLLIKKFTN